jgi:hypothetical protein
MGLGIACLTLVLSGVTRAGQIKTDKGNYGNNDDKNYKHDKNYDDKDKCDVNLDLCNDIKQECKKLEKDGCKDVKCDEKLKDCKSDKCDKDDKGKDHCKIEWKKHDKHDFCFDDKNKYDDHCHIVIDRCHHDHCEPSGCDPVAVPAPASSAMSGAGLIGLALMAFARSRRSINA